MFRTRRRGTAIVAAGALVAAGIVAGPATPAHAQTACSVDYQTNEWTSGPSQGGFTANITITNQGSAINGWTLTFSFPGNQQLTQGWSATWSQSGSQVTANSMDWNSSLASGASTNIGFNGSWTGSNPTPTDFALNGTPCNGGTPPTTTPPTTTPPTTTPPTTTPPTTPPGEPTVWDERFLEQYQKIKSPSSGYFSPEGIPYHAVETLIVEAPDHGHETTSEAFSFWLWLEATYGRVMGDWGPFNDAWQTMEEWIIPSREIQPTNERYNPGDPASYAAEYPEPDMYPAQLDFDVPVGQDPIANELRNAYGSAEVYGMHWLMDVDNVYGFGRCGDGVPGPAMINTYQRGTQESVFETIPHPSCERFNYGGPNGFLDLFVGDDEYAQQWRYTNAPDADARAVQAAYWALTWAKEQGNQSQISSSVADAAKMGDWLRYAMYDKYFKRIGNCVGPNECPAGSGKDSSHYLLSWYYAWGGGLTADWAFRIGSSHTHQGYQNPMAAWALAGNVSELTPKSSTAATDWQESLDRQLEFFQWLQAPEGGIAGGATNSWEGSYGTPPAGTPTFYGMFYDEKPVYHDPPSNQWFGFQVWSLQRVAEYLYVTGDSRAKAVLDKWVPWAMENTRVNGSDFEVPSEMQWSGAPDTWNASNPGANRNLSVRVVSGSQDVGVASGLARTLMWYAAAVGDTAAQAMSLDLIEALHANSDDLGVVTTETREDFNRLNDEVYVPRGFSGTMPNGDRIEPGATFDSIRSFYYDDPDWPEVQAYLDGQGPAPSFDIHRFWAQSDIAMAYADYSLLFPEES